MTDSLLISILFRSVPLPAVHRQRPELLLLYFPLLPLLPERYILLRNRIHPALLPQPEEPHWYSDEDFLYFLRPVPAGISLPKSTFSFRPISGSIFPLIAASVRTLVVSWKDAADRKEFVAREAFVIPRSVCSAVAALFLLRSVHCLSSSSSRISTRAPGRYWLSPASSIRTFLSI